MLKKLIASGALSVSVLAVAAFLIPSAMAADDADQDKPAIRMVVLNKGDFKAEEEVYTLVRWSVGDLTLPSKGSQVSGKTPIINVTITKGDKLCADPAVLTLFSGETEAYLPIKAIADCISPTVRAVLIDANGQLVSDKMAVIAGGVEVTSDQVKQDEKVLTLGAVANQENSFRSLGFVISIALAGIGVIAILVVLIRRRSMAKKLMAFIFAFGVSAIVSGAYVAEAQFDMAWPEMDFVWLDKTTYVTGETATINVLVAGCQWNWEIRGMIDVLFSFNGSGYTQLVGPQLAPIMSRPSNLFCPEISGTRTFVTPAVPGIYDLVIKTRVDAMFLPIVIFGVGVGPYDINFFTSTNWFAEPSVAVSGGYGYITMPIVVGSSSALTPPAVTFSPDSYSISGGTSTNLHWTATNATSCTASGAWSGAKAVNGTESTGILSASQVYFLSCTGPGGTSPLYTVPLTVIPVIPIVDLQVNGSNGPITLAAGASKNLSWAATNATSCMASGVDAFTGSKAVPSGSETLTVARTSTDTLTCTGPGGTTSDSVQVNASCPPSTGAWGVCDCTTETKSRTNINASCLPWTESEPCTTDEKNSCRDFNWKEVAP